MGGIAAAVVAIYLKLPAPLLIAATFVGGFIAGGLYALIPAVLKVKANTNEVVSTLMLNYVAILFTSYLVNYPLKAPKAPMGMTVEIQEAAKLPLLYEGSRFNIGFIIAILAAIAISVFFKYSSSGYEMRMLGNNKNFARYIGIDTDKRVLQKYVHQRWAGRTWRGYPGYWYTISVCAGYIAWIWF